VAPMAHSPRVALFPATHPLASRVSVSLEELAEEPILDPGYGDDPLMFREYWLGGTRGPVVGPPVRTVEEMCAFVAAGMGMAITSGTIAAQYGRPDLAFVPIEGLAPVEVGLVRLREDERPPLVAVFNELRDHPGRS
jgi:DNA-binding transcriptional LysR family regulator